MTGGILRRTGFKLGAAALGLSVVGAAPALAADKGGGEAADLEERVAELEATTARKGNRKVSLTISGSVNQAILFWDDGRESNQYVVTNEASQDRVRFLGEAEITKGWKAGYLLELGIRGAREDRVHQGDPVGGASANGVALRHSAFWVSNKELGKLWVGQTSDAADGITEINVANTNHFANANKQFLGDGGSGFRLRRTNGTLVSNVQWGDLLVPGLAQGIPGEGHRYNVVKYETPTIAGFVASASWGEDDIWDLALRYKGEAGGFKYAAGIAYIEQTDQTAANARGAGDTQEFGLSGSIQHVDTGLYLTGAYGHLEDDTTALRNLSAGAAYAPDNETEYWFLQGGIEKKFFPVGKTTLFGEYWNLDRGTGISVASDTGVVSLTNASGLATVGAGGTNYIRNSEVTGWGLGANQNFSDFFDIYVLYNHVEADVTVANTVNAGSAKASLENFDYVFTGAQIKF